MKGCIDTKSAVRTCAFSYSGKMVAFSTDKQMGHPCIINVVDTRTFHADKPVMTIPIPPKGPKVKCDRAIIVHHNSFLTPYTNVICQVTSLVWGTLDEQIVTGHDNGDIVQWDVKTHQKVKIVSDHAKSISDMQLSADSKINT